MWPERERIGEEMRPARWPAIVAQAGLLVVAFSAAYTMQPEGMFSRGEWVAFGIIGLAALVVGIACRGEDARGVLGAGTLGLVGAAALYLSYDPQLASLPGMSGLGMGTVGLLKPSLAHVGVILAALFLAVQLGVDRRALADRVPFRGAVVAAALLVLVLAGVMWLGLHNIYDLSGTSSIGELIFRTLAYTVLMVTCLTLSGARGVGGAAHLYMGAALLIAVARNVLG